MAPNAPRISTTTRRRRAAGGKRRVGRRHARTVAFFRQQHGWSQRRPHVRSRESRYRILCLRGAKAKKSPVSRFGPVRGGRRRDGAHCCEFWGPRWSVLSVWCRLFRAAPDILSATDTCQSASSVDLVGRHRRWLREKKRNIVLFHDTYRFYVKI